MSDTGAADRLRSLVRDVADFPSPGIVFKDITPLLADPRGLATAVDAMTAPWVGQDVDMVVGIEARGFILGAPVARALGAGFVPARKQGKLPWATTAESYGLEYGDDVLELHVDALVADHRVLIVDDVLATGGTASAAGRLVASTGALLVGFGFLIELAFLGGRDRLGGHHVESVIVESADDEPLIERGAV